MVLKDLCSTDTHFRCRIDGKPGNPPRTAKQYHYPLFPFPDLSILHCLLAATRTAPLCIESDVGQTSNKMDPDTGRQKSTCSNKILTLY
ncbi:hypothetical protein PBY51_012665 [Eleginops maclovinus]|uniref:Uncharacterized protein n=1 Tax=Eleginops maclovinus TaxID=56733 RepID=A0AAN7Y0Q9_ELEMC|nr:hypothetical protein PBY51_012665 [Eleginops maclovinus]